MKAIGNFSWEAPYGLSVSLMDAAKLPALYLGSGYAVTALTPQSAVRASRVFTDAGVADGETLTIVRVDGSSQVYTWKTALTPTIGQVLIGASNTTALANMLAAIVGVGGTPGTTHALGTPPCLDWEGTSDGTTITLQAINYGDEYNTAIDAFAEACASGSWAASTAGVDTPDFKTSQDNLTTAEAAASAAPILRNGHFRLAPTAAQLTCKRRDYNFLDDDQDGAGGIDTATSLWLRQGYQVITTHHPAAGDPKGVLYCGVLDDPTDLAAAGTTVEIPNLSHADDGDWLGGDYSPPDTDNIFANCLMELFNPDTGLGLGWFAEVKSYDYDGGTGNQGLVTFAVGAGIPASIAVDLRAGARVFYRIYSSNIGRVAELGTQAKADVNAEADTALSDYAGLKPTVAGRTLDVSAGGEAGVDWANVGSPTTSNGLTGTTISTSQVVASVTAGVTLAASAVQAIWDALTSALTTAGSIGKYILDHIVGTLASGTHTAQTGDSFARLGAPAGASVSADIADLPTNAELATSQAAADDATLAAISSLDTKIGTPAGVSVSADIAAIEAQTDDIGVAGAGLTDLGGMSTTMKAQVESEVEDGITDMFGIVTGTVNDAAATVNGFTVTDTAGTDIRLGVLRFTSGALAGESRLVTWTGTTIAVVKPTSVPAGLTTIGPFSAAVANGVAYTFRPL